MILRKKIQCRNTKNEWKKLPQPYQLIKFFLLMQYSWQRLMSDSTSWPKTLKNSHNLQIQWPVVSTHCQETKIPLNRKVGFKETPKNGPLLEFTTSYLQGNYGVEIRIESVNKDNSHSWVRTSHGLNKLVTDLSNNKENDNTEQETSEMQFEEYAFGLNESDFASRSKAKAKPRRRTSACSSTRTVPICERIWIDIEPVTQWNIAYPVNNWVLFFVMVIYLEKMMEQLNSGEKGKSSEQIWALSTLVWRYVEEQDGRRRRQQVKYQCCTDPSGQEIYLRALQGHSRRTSDAQSNYTLSWIQDWYREDKILARDRRYSSRLWILWTRNIEIQMKLT